MIDKGNSIDKDILRCVVKVLYCDSLILKISRSPNFTVSSKMKESDEIGLL